MVSVTGSYLGDLRCETVHGPSGAKLLTDAPVDNQGRGRQFSPTDLVGTALGTCILTILGIVGERRGLDLTSARFQVEKEMVADPKRRIGMLAVTIWLPAHLTEKDRRALETAAHTCPVHQSLSDRVAAPIRFIYE